MGVDPSDAFQKAFDEVDIDQHDQDVCSERECLEWDIPQLKTYDKTGPKVGRR